MSSNPDPVDQAQNYPAPSPSPDNPFNPAPSTTGVQTASPNAPRSAGDAGAPPTDFARWANSILEQKIGRSNYALIPRAQKQALLRKIWNDSSIQSEYTIMQGNPSAVGALISSVQSVLMGQGDDPTVVNDYVDLKSSVGVGLTLQEQAALAGATQATNAPVPKPFGTNVVSGYDFGAPMPPGGWTGDGQSYGWDTHMGVDYGTRAGDRILSPFAGTVTVETGVAGYGNYVTVTLDNGWKMGFGHVASGSVQNGARVNPGDLIAIAGANVGSAQGSVTIVTWQDPTGKYVNPHDVLDSIFSGTTFAGIGAQGAAGTGMPTINKILDAEYPSIKSDWLAYFGTPPSPEDVYNVLHNGSNPAQWTDYIRSIPSHITGLTMGQYHDLRMMADQVSTQILGHPATDSIVAELQAGNHASKQAVTNWYNEHGVTGIPQEEYQQIYKATQPIYKNIFNEPAGADPRDIKHIHESRRERGEALGGPRQ